MQTPDLHYYSAYSARILPTPEQAAGSRGLQCAAETVQIVCYERAAMAMRDVVTLLASVLGAPAEPQDWTPQGEARALMTLAEFAGIPEDLVVYAIHDDQSRLIRTDVKFPDDLPAIRG